MLLQIHQQGAVSLAASPSPTVHSEHMHGFDARVNLRFETTKKRICAHLHSESHTEPLARVATQHITNQPEHFC